MKSRLNNKKIIYITLSAYIISLSSFQLGFGFDAWFTRLSFLFYLLSIIFVKKIILNTQAKWYLIFWIFYFSSIFWAKNPNDTFYYVNNFIQIIGISLMLPSIVEKKEDIDKIFKIIIFSILITSIIVFLRSPNLLSNIERIGEVVGLHPNTLGMRLAVGSLLLLYFLSKNKNLHRRKFSKSILPIMLVIIFSVMLILTGSKKSLFILIFGALFFEVIHQKGMLFLPKAIIGTILVAGVLYFIYNNEVMYQIMGKRVEYTINTIIGNTTSRRIDTSLLERQFYASQAILLFVKNPLLGYGGNNFVAYMREISYSHVAYSHNNYLELLSTLGIVGFTIYYSIWMLTLFKISKICTNRKDHQSTIFMVFILLFLITDTGNVSYISEFNAIIFVLANIYINIAESDNIRLKVGDLK